MSPKLLVANEDDTLGLVWQWERRAFLTPTSKNFPRASRKKWEAYCNTDGAQTGGVLKVIPFPQVSEAPKVLQYKSEVYCNANGRMGGVLPSDFMRFSPSRNWAIFSTFWGDVLLNYTGVMQKTWRRQK